MKGEVVLSAVISCLLILPAAPSHAVVFFVNPSATGANNGLSWADAFRDLQAAIDAAGDCGGGEVWVKAGTYNTLQPAAVSDSFEARDPNAVDIVGEEMDCWYTSNGVLKGDHLTVMYTTGPRTTSPPAATFGSTTDSDSLAARLSALTQRSDILVFINHPGRYSLTKEDLLAAANAGALHGMELLNADDVAKWDYVLANLDDQAGDCCKILWAVRSNDQHFVTGVNHMKGHFQAGMIPTTDQDPVYADRRVAFKDMIRRGSTMALRGYTRCAIPTYDFVTGPGGVPGFQVNLRLLDMPGATRAELRFYGNDPVTGPGTKLYSVPLNLNSLNNAKYYLTSNGSPTGVPLAPEQRASIKYIRPELMVTGSGGVQTGLFAPVRIRADGSWWNGPLYTLAGGHASVNGSPYPAGGADSGETVYYEQHMHSLNSDGNSTPTVMRHRYWTDFGHIDPDKPRFAVLTDHGRRTPFSNAVANVIVLRGGVRLYGGFSGTETNRSQRDPAVNATVIDGQDAGRCVYADGTEWGDPSGAVLDGFTIKRGASGSSDGAGVLALNCGVTLENCAFTANNAGYGGAVLSASTAVINRCTFSSNNASLVGGAILNGEATSSTITNCLFTGNTAHKGAAVASANCSPSISGCTLLSNTCISRGGLEGGSAFYHRYASGSVTNCMLRNNVVTGSKGAGGGFALYQSSPLIANNCIVGSTAAEAAAMNVRDNSTPRIVNNIIAYNSSGILQASDSHALASNNCLHANGQYDYSGMSPGPGDVFQDPLFVNRTSGNLSLRPESPCIDAASIAYAPASDWEGRKRPFDGNSDGLAVADIGAQEYRWLYVDRNAPGPDRDGCSWATAFPTIQEAVNACIGHDAVWVADGVYEENLVLRNGVGLYGGFAGDEGRLDQRRWAEHPSVIDGRGAASAVTIPAGCNSDTRLDAFTVRNGEAVQGGGIHISSSSPIVTNCTVTGNNAVYGGGIFCYYSPGVTVSGNVIARNTAAGGGGLFLSASSGAQVINNTFCENAASMDGGAVLASSSPSVLANNIVAFNNSGIRSFGAQELKNNCVYGNTAYEYKGLTPGSADISVNPLLRNRNAGDYHLIVGSPCIDAGYTSQQGSVPWDIDGEPRLCSAWVDIGADEMWPGMLYVWDAKRARDGAILQFHGGIVTAVFGDSFYVECEGRYCAVRVDCPGHGVVPGVLVRVDGTVGTDSNGERYVDASTVLPVGSGSVKPMSVLQKYLGGGDWFYDPAACVGQRGVKDGVGANNLGLLVTSVGRVTSTGEGFLYMDDGSHLLDGTTTDGRENLGVRVQCDPRLYSVGDVLRVTGISSTMERGGYLYRLLKATDVAAIE